MVESAATAATATTATAPVAPHIIGSPFIGVRQGRIRIIQLLEHLLAFVGISVLVGMVKHRHTAICLLDFIIAGFLVNPEDFVIVLVFINVVRVHKGEIVLAEVAAGFEEDIRSGACAVAWAKRKVEEHTVVDDVMLFKPNILYTLLRRTSIRFAAMDTSPDIPFIAKYQPLKIHEFEQLDENTITIIRSLIEMDNLNIMFYGDSGSGKTSIINATIREYYKKSSSAAIHENIMVLNSLKEQGIQYYRNDVKVFCQTMTMIPNRKKIVLLDDIDLINEQGQQVFRNCIDKYSHNVHFISSCTNIQKVVDTFQTRNIIIKINQLNRGCLNKIMWKIKSNEHLKIMKDAEEFLLQVSNGSVRTLINYLEKIKLIDREITYDIANRICTNISFHRFEEYTREVLRCDTDGGGLRAANAILFQLNDEGYSVLDILDNYFLFVKLTPMFDEDMKFRITSLICKYITIFHNIHEHDIELALFTNNLVGLRGCPPGCPPGVAPPNDAVR